jgi:hypothetical protein
MSLGGGLVGRWCGGRDWCVEGGAGRLAVLSWSTSCSSPGPLSLSKCSLMECVACGVWRLPRWPPSMAAALAAALAQSCRMPPVWRTGAHAQTWDVVGFDPFRVAAGVAVARPAHTMSCTMTMSTIHLHASERATAWDEEAAE